ncbi:HAMP domain-containing histidine kinase [Flammeovirga yaeyamensis]|uniref:histidine kinase n=1 Tax=Flammeovirga yaeyamensis TaxID=367791 RepID=A0AAX1NDQ9_9BACT|nr:HAMP domain-containing sensor histidine kinase [Flammeovirga yaeyamensis]MBB3698733.1 signal transduction histidine kinase [Flammeovirga yaeyamensis]NMF37319.1 HAMP domain-containing histidine kinase [Flammeovirga yaeyamensis]QWG03863.1 HAMP domain-containing histidine kinase [Flammeovirga yaeyamensis]
MQAKIFLKQLINSKSKAVLGLFFSLISILIFLINVEYYDVDEYDKFVQDRIQQLSKNADDVIYDIKNNIKEVSEEEPDFKTLLSLSAQPVYIYEKGVLKFWSDDKLKLKYIEDKLFTYFVEDVIKKGNSFYYVRKSNIMLYNQDYEIFVIVPLLELRDSPTTIMTHYVNDFIFGTKDLPKIDKYKVNENFKPIYTKQNNYLFSLDTSKKVSIELFPWHSFIFCVLVATFCLLSALSTYITDSIHKGSSIYIMLSVFIIGVLALHEVVFSIVNNPIIKNEYEILSSLSNPPFPAWDSMGVIFIDLIFILSVFRWVTNNFKDLFSVTSMKKLPLRVRITLSSIMIILLFIIVMLLENVYLKVLEYSLSLNPQFSVFEISIPYVVSQMIVLLGFLIAGSYAHVSFRIISWWLDFYGKATVMLISIIVVFSIQFFDNSFDLVVINVLAIFTGITLMFDTTKFLNSGKFKAIMYLMSHIILFSLLAAVVVEKSDTKKDEEFKQKFAYYKLITNDATLNAFLEETINDVQDDDRVIDAVAFLNKPHAVEVSKLIKADIMGWFGQRYDISVYMAFDNGDVVNSEYSYNQLIENFFDGKKNVPKDISGLNNKMDLQKGTFSYLCNIPIIDRFTNTDTIGYCLIELNKKSLEGNYLQASILDENYNINYKQEDYSYAIFFKKELIFSSGDYNYTNDFLKEIDLNEESNLASNFEFNGYEHLMLPNANRIVVISSKEFNIIDFIRSFSTYFTIIVFFVFSFYNFKNYIADPKEYNRSFSAKVQAYLNVAIFLPIFTLAIVMGSVMVKSSRNDIQRQYLEKAQTVAMNLFQNTDLNADWNPENDLVLDNFINELSNIMQADIRFYNKKGFLKSASDDELFEAGILSEQLNPEAYIGIMQDKKTRLVVKEKIGNLEYNTSYIGVKAFNTGDVMGVVSIPFFKSLHRFDDRTVDVISTIMIIFTVLFITLLPIVHYAALSLLNPIKLIIPELNRITLSKKNAPIKYHSNDEFGRLVGEYNKMLSKLEESKKELERSQLESAWKDVAKQVAHEIKNPLTPMKLYLQQLERVATSDDNPKLLRATKMLISQVDTLSGIVTSFSSFAQMPVPKREVFNLSKVIKDTVMLHSSKAKIQFSNTQLGHDVFVDGDEKLTTRILANLILNGIQAAKEDVSSNIIIDLYENGEKAIVTVIDNGKGIPEEFQNKVFVPNFTTKETGSGIGLAVAKRGIEQMGGSIWFETKENEGTQFFVEFVMTQPEEEA